MGQPHGDAVCMRMTIKERVAYVMKCASWPAISTLQVAPSQSSESHVAVKTSIYYEWSALRRGAIP